MPLGGGLVVKSDANPLTLPSAFGTRQGARSRPSGRVRDASVRWSLVGVCVVCMGLAGVTRPGHPTHGGSMRRGRGIW